MQLEDDGATASLGGGSGVSAPATMPIRLRTSLPGCSIPYVPYMVPVTWRRSQLSTLVNKVLAAAQGSETEGDAKYKSVPFDFIVNGELLRCSLEEYLAQHGESAESALELEYIRSTLPPAFKDAARQDDWVSSIDARRPGVVLTASYDGRTRVYDLDALTSEPQTYTPSYATDVSLTSARWLQLAGDVQTLATGSMDGTVAVWRVPAVPGATSPIPIVQAMELRHHTSPVSTIDTYVRGDRAAVLSAGWDGTIALWDVPADAPISTSRAPADEGAPTKKRRGARGAQAPSQAEASTVQPPMAPTMVLHHVVPTLGASAAKALGTAPTPGANARTLASFDQGDRRIWSAGWDGAVKCWDVEAGGVLQSQKQSDKVALALDPVRGAHPASAHPEVMTGHMDHSIALYDFRDAVTNAAVAIANAHAAPVSALRTHPTSSYLFASGAYDGRIKVWDVRSPKQALFALSQPVSVSRARPTASAQKILGLDWTPEGDRLVAGGEDCCVSVYQGQAIGVEHV